MELPPGRCRLCVLRDADRHCWVEREQVEERGGANVFVNLLANAAKYTESGGKLAVSLEVRDGQALCRIRDSGIGIEPQLLPHVFDLFRRGKAADTNSTSGLGIGLAVVRNLVELHGGKVTATSGGLGLGSEFTIRLPIHDPSTS